MDEFKTIANRHIIEYREKASKFIAIIAPVESEEEAEEIRLELWKQHPKANHICYAYRIGMKGEVFKMNDDGEPSGTAGRPIYGQLLSQNLTDICIYVVRYFGGTKLGTSGLIAAYKDSSKLAIEQASIVTKSLQEIYELVFEYEQMGKVMNVIKNMDLIILNKNFESQPYVRIAIKSSEVKNKIRKLKADLLEYSLDRIEDDTQVPFCKITYLYNQKV